MQYIDIDTSKRYAGHQRCPQLHAAIEDGQRYVDIFDVYRKPKAEP